MEIPARKGVSFSQPKVMRTIKKSVIAGKTSVAKDGRSLSKLEDGPIAKIIDIIVKFSIYLTAFLIPLFFLGNVPSVLELNKQILLAVLVGIGFLAWVGKMAWKNEIRFRKSFILVPIVTFLAVIGISSFTSDYTEQSLWGYFGGEAQSFMSTLFFVALFFLVFNNIKTKKEAGFLVIFLIVGGLLVAVFGMLQLWGKFIFSSEISRNNFFNTIGSVYMLGVYLGAILLLAVSIFVGRLSKLTKILVLILCFVLFFVLLAVNLKLVWIGLIISLALILGTSIVDQEAKSSQTKILPMIFLVFSVVMFLLGKQLVKVDTPVEVFLNHKTSVKIMFSSWKKSPLLGVGPANYLSVYKLNRPDNLGDFWSINFDNASSFFFTLASTTGILGTLAFLFLIIVGTFELFRSISNVLFKRQTDEAFLAVGMGSVWLFLTIMNLIYFSNISLLMLWWLSLAVFLSLGDQGREQKDFVTTSATPKSSLTLSFVFVLVIIGFITAIYLQTQKYVAAIYFNQALLADAKGDDVQGVAEKIQKAISIDPNRDIYYRNMSVAMFALANKRVSEKGQDLSADDTNYVSSMIKGALQASDQAISLYNKEASNFISLAQVYEGVLTTMDGADEKAIENYLKAIELDPNNPSLYEKIANIYVTLADVETAKAQQQKSGQPSDLPDAAKQNLSKAKEYIGKSLEVKNDYASTNLLLASVYEREGNLDKAIEKEQENIALYPGEPVLYFRVGLLQYKKEDLDLAEKSFLEAVKLDKNYSNARYFLGLIYDKRKDKDKALEQFNKIIELNPDNQDIKKIIENIKRGKAALDGVAAENEKNGGSDSGSAETNQSSQPQINPQVENQEIPAKATPQIEEKNNN